MSAQPTYILAPSFRFKPGTGPIALGNLISDPLRPHRALTMVEPAKLHKSYPRVETFTDYDRSITRGKQQDLSMSVWTEFIQTISGKVSGGGGSDSQFTHTMDSLETTYFVADPSLEEIQERLKSPRVQAVTKASRIPGLRNPVYMVTGVMVAKGFSTERENEVHRNGGVELSGNAPTAVQVGAGASLSRFSSDREGDKWRAGEDIVFAYQLLKIEIKGWKGARIEWDELRHKAACLGEDDRETDEEEDGSLEEIEVNSTMAENLPSDAATAGFAATELGDGPNRINCISLKEE